MTRGGPSISKWLALLHLGIKPVDHLSYLRAVVIQPFAMILRVKPGMALSAFVLLAACSDSVTGDISRDSEPFGAISPDAAITLVGTEPFWTLEIAAGSARYTTPENLDGSAFAVSRFAGNNGLGFSGELDGQDVVVAVTPGDCSDSMSERTYPYTATLAIGDATVFGCGYTSDEPFTGDQTP